MRNRIRIESHQNIVTDAKIIYIDEDGAEVDISRCVQGVDLHLHLGELSKASIHAILIDGDVTAEIVEAFVSRIPRRRRWWRWSRSSVEVTRYGSKAREYA